MEQKLRVRLYQPYLRLIMWHMLNKRLIWKLLRTIGNVLCGISWWGGHNRWACCWGWVHHGALMMLVLPLLGHIWYCRKDDLVLENTISSASNTWTRSTRLCKMWPSCLPLQCHAIPLPPPLQPLSQIFLLHVLLVLRLKHQSPTPSLDNSDSSFWCHPESNFLRGPL